jgi:hypothetical protein
MRIAQYPSFKSMKSGLGEDLYRPELFFTWKENFPKTLLFIG